MNAITMEAPRRLTLAEIRGDYRSPAQRAVDRFSAFVEGNAGVISSLLPQGGQVVRLRQTATALLLEDPGLGRCGTRSLAAAIVMCMRLGLEPNTPQQHVYISARWDPDAGEHRAEVILGYRGMIELAHRSGRVTSIIARVVHRGDQFDMLLGTVESVTHRPRLDNDPGEVIGYYAVAHLDRGPPLTEWMRAGDVQRLREASPAWQEAERSGRHDSVWHTSPDQMGRKAPLRRLYRYLPTSDAMALAAELDGCAEAGRPQRMPPELAVLHDLPMLDDAPDEAAPPAAPTEAQAPPAEPDSTPQAGQEEAIPTVALPGPESQPSAEEEVPILAPAEDLFSGME